jgi:hypothetical protein
MKLINGHAYLNVFTRNKGEEMQFLEKEQLCFYYGRTTISDKLFVGRKIQKIQNHWSSVFSKS